MSNKAKIREEALKLNPIDDIMFRKMAENIEFCQEILRVILEDPDLVILEAVPQWTGTNLPIYHIDRIIRETKTVVDNGFKEIYVNTKINDGSDIAGLMQVFVNDDTYDNRFPVTSETKKILKNTEGGAHSMSEVLDRLIAEEIREGKLAAMREGRRVIWFMMA